MPIYSENPFFNPARFARKDVNPFLSVVLDNAHSKHLPILSGDQLQTLKGQWQNEFAKLNEGFHPEKIILEIGSHKGDVLNQMAADFPSYGFVGMDITFKRVVLAARQAKMLSNTNIISILANGKGIDQLFAANELAGVVVFFPDPWCRKKSQHKKRLLNSSFSHKLYDILAPGGFLWFKTDHEPYFAEANGALTAAGFELGVFLDKIPTKRYTSHFEAQFMEKSAPIYDETWVKPRYET